MSGAEFMSPHDVEAETGLSYDAVRRAISSGELKATKVRGRIKIRREWFDAWIDANMVSPTVRAAPVRAIPVAVRPASPVGSLDRLRAIERGEL